MLFCLKFAFADAAALTLKTTSRGGNGVGDVSGGFCV